MRWLVVFGAVALFATALLRARNAGRRSAAMRVQRGGTGDPIRVGGLIYRVMATHRVGAQVIVDLVRSNATQTFFSAESARIRIRVQDDEHFAPSHIGLLECHGGAECTTLDPGESRRDEFAFAIPPGITTGLVLDVVAGASETGPRRGEVSLTVR